MSVTTVSKERCYPDLGAADQPHSPSASFAPSAPSLPEPATNVQGGQAKRLPLPQVSGGSAEILRRSQDGPPPAYSSDKDLCDDIFVNLLQDKDFKGDRPAKALLSEVAARELSSLRMMARQLTGAEHIRKSETLLKAVLRQFANITIAAESGDDLLIGLANHDDIKSDTKANKVVLGQFKQEAGDRSDAVRRLLAEPDFRANPKALDAMLSLLPPMPIDAKPVERGHDLLVSLLTSKALWGDPDALFAAKTLLAEPDADIVTTARKLLKVPAFRASEPGISLLVQYTPPLDKLAGFQIGTGDDLLFALLKDPKLQHVEAVFTRMFHSPAVASVRDTVRGLLADDGIRGDDVARKAVIRHAPASMDKIRCQDDLLVALLQDQRIQDSAAADVVGRQFGHVHDSLPQLGKSLMRDLRKNADAMEALTDHLSNCEEEVTAPSRDLRALSLGGSGHSSSSLASTTQLGSGSTTRGDHVVSVSGRSMSDSQNNVVSNPFARREPVAPMGRSVAPKSLIDLQKELNSEPLNKQTQDRHIALIRTIPEMAEDERMSAYLAAKNKTMGVTIKVDDAVKAKCLPALFDQIGSLGPADAVKAIREANDITAQLSQKMVFGGPLYEAFIPHIKTMSDEKVAAHLFQTVLKKLDWSELEIFQGDTKRRAYQALIDVLPRFGVSATSVVLHGDLAGKLGNQVGLGEKAIVTRDTDQKTKASINNGLRSLMEEVIVRFNAFGSIDIAGIERDADKYEQAKFEIYKSGLKDGLKAMGLPKALGKPLFDAAFPKGYDDAGKWGSHMSKVERMLRPKP